MSSSTTYTIKTIPKSGTHRYGWFGVRGRRWTEEFNKADGPVRKIFISHNNSIRSIQMVYLNNGQDQIYQKYGGYGRHFREIDIKTGVFIKGISGRLSFWSKTLKSITFHTSDGKKLGPFGGKEGRGYSFSYLFSDGINGFEGVRTKTRIVSIGVTVQRQGEVEVQPTQSTVVAEESNQSTDRSEGSCRWIERCCRRIWKKSKNLQEGEQQRVGGEQVRQDGEDLEENK